MDIRILEDSLQHFVGLPQPRKQARKVVRRTDPMLQVRAQLQLVRSAAREIGQVPQGYPFPLHILMKVISALLPWYTRPLQVFSVRVTDALDSMEACLVDLNERQSAASEETAEPEGQG